MMKNWAIYRYEGAGMPRYLGVVSANGKKGAVLKAIKLLPRKTGGPLRGSVGRSTNMSRANATG